MQKVTKARLRPRIDLVHHETLDLDFACFLLSPFVFEVPVYHSQDGCCRHCSVLGSRRKEASEQDFVRLD